MNYIIPEIAFGSMLVFLAVLFACTIVTNASEARSAKLDGEA